MGMYESLDNCMRSMFRNELFSSANGGLVTKYPKGFDYNLNNVEPPDTGRDFIGVYRSAVPEYDWIAFFHGGDEARFAYRAFASDPANSDLRLRPDEQL